MVATIAPVVYGRRRDYLLAIVAHVVAATATAAFTGMLLAAAGRVFGAPWGSAGVIAVGAVALLYFTREALHVPVPLPNAKRQVPEWWRTFFPRPVAAALYGAGLGIAFATFLSFGTFVAVAAGAVTSGELLTGAVLTAPFGLARGVGAVVAGARLGEPGEAVATVAELGETRTPRLINATVLAMVAAAAAGAAGPL